MERPRIAYVITDLHTGGVPLHLLRLAAAVRERGYDPCVICLAKPGAVSELLRSQGIATHACDASGPTDLAAIWRLARLLRRTRPEVVHSFLFHANVASRVAVRLAGISHLRLICELQTVEIERRWHLVVGGLTHRWCYCVVGNSPSVVEHLGTRAHMAASKLRCIPGGVDVSSIRDAPAADRASLPIDDDARVVLWVGRLDPVKGLDELIDAFRAITDETGAHLLLAGDGTYGDAVRKRIERNRSEDRVHLLGTRSDVPGLLKIADVFAFPSHTEGMPNALLEAMAAGRPIVTTDVPGCRDLVTDGVSGLLVPAYDSVALAAAVVRLLSDRGLAARLGGRAAAHIDAHHTFAACVARYLALYREVLGQPVPRPCHL